MTLKDSYSYLNYAMTHLALTVFKHLKIYERIESTLKIEKINIINKFFLNIILNSKLSLCSRVLMSRDIG